jgi:tetratricopeptide (TPR) repeat protein
MSADENQMAEFTRLLEAFHEAQERGDVKAAELIAVQCLLHVGEEQKKNPSEDLRLLGEAIEHENAGRWAQAEVAYRQILALAETEGNPGCIYMAHSDLSSLYSIQGMTDRALKEAKTAVEAARKTDMESLLLTALGNLARCHLMKGDIALAAAAAAEAVRTAPADKRYDIQRARALLMRAQCRIEQHQASDAQCDLNVAWELLAPLAGASRLAGVQGRLAHWWEITARIRSASKDLEGAAEALSRAVELWRAVSSLPQLDGPYKYFWLANALKQYSVTLSAAGRVEAATKAFEESCAIHERIRAGATRSSMT